MIRSIPAEGGDPAQVATWRAKADLCRRYGLAVFPDLGGQGYFDAILQDLYDHVLRQPMPPAFVAGRGLATLGDRYGDAYHPDYVSAYALETRRKGASTRRVDAPPQTVFPALDAVTFPGLVPGCLPP